MQRSAALVMGAVLALIAGGCGEPSAASAPEPSVAAASAVSSTPAASATSSAQSAVTSPGPQTVVQSFYDWRFRTAAVSPSGPGRADLAVRPEPAPEFVDALMAALTELPTDRITCVSQQPADRAVAGAATVSGNSAIVEVATYTGQQQQPLARIQVELALAATWRIVAVSCPRPGGGAALRIPPANATPRPGPVASATDASGCGVGRLQAPFPSIEPGVPVCGTSGAWTFSARAGDLVTVRLEAASGSAARPSVMLMRAARVLASAWQNPNCAVVTVAVIERFAIPEDGAYEIFTSPGSDPSLPCQGTGPMLLTLTRN